MAEEITVCPSCGSEVVEGRRAIDDYRIEKVLHEGYSSILCRGMKSGTEEPVMIRLFTPESGVDEKIADRLKQELEELKKLPGDYFVRHLDIRQSSDGLWYRVSEWIEKENWGTLLASGRLQDYRVTFRLFYRIASILEGLHQIGHFIPHLILDDIMVFKSDQEEFEVKIDYKLSRFLDPGMDRPGPMLQRLLNCHPDIINRRPLDFRSDIWSLGKIFTELLTADFETKDFLQKIDNLPLPQEIAVLFKIMLAEDPDLRPRSMAEVAETLSRVNDEQIEAARQSRLDSAPVPQRQMKRFKRRIVLLGILAAVLGLLLGGLLWYYVNFMKKDSETILVNYADQYAESVGFVMVDYRLLAGEYVVYQRRTEGTAFLVDKKGYLLTSRHVACPWLEDSNLYVIINRLRQNRRLPRLEYQAFLWFEGEKAFQRLPDFSSDSDIEDLYDLDSAFRTDGSRRLTISGVAKPPTRTWQLVKSPLKDDFAVLKIDPVPAGLEPLPLDLDMDPLKIPRLSPVMTLGFPLGSGTQEMTVNVSVTQGHVRRTFENMLQVDTSLHSGNSGGPIIDIHGKVIGIASGVAMGWAVGPLPIATPLSDIGMILPITKAVRFIQDLKAGHVKWNGVLDLSLDMKLAQITEKARKGQWTDAKVLADKELRFSHDPTLVMAAGMIHFCAGDNEGAGRLFSQALSMDDENDEAKLMLFLIDWLDGSSHANRYRRELLNLDWRSPTEFLGYLVKVLEGMVDEESALKGGYTEGEKSWIHYVVGLIRAGRGALANSEEFLRKAVLTAGVDDWSFFLALAHLEKIQNLRLEALENKPGRGEYQVQIRAFADIIEKTHEAKSEQRTKLAPLLARLKQESIGPEEKRQVMEKVLEIDPGNGEVLSGLAFCCAMSNDWEPALEYARRFLEFTCRENAAQLGVGLLEAEILHNAGRKEEAKAGLEDYYRRIKDPWYLAISEYLLGKQTEQSLSELIGESRENLVTWHTALGFWAEGLGDKNKAIKHYREALGTYMDTTIEYDFARERIKRLRRPSE
ncbi:MAG: trypsin-like peptidase domain-containing protein [Deltaproteobacteria bacterium]|nr:trypsin-like peptidase domain-containing protein [Deltaproteobacteria bacterium]